MIAGTHLTFTILLCSTLFAGAAASRFSEVVILLVVIGLDGLCIAEITLSIHHLFSLDLEGLIE